MISAEVATTLQQTYKYLRRIEHGLQMEQGAQTHTLPRSAAQQQRLARYFGYTTWEAFYHDYLQRTDTVHALFTAAFEGDAAVFVTPPRLAEEATKEQHAFAPTDDQPTAAHDVQDLQQEVMRRCPNVPPAVLEAMFAQLDADYFQLFTAAQIAAHAVLLAAVDDQHPVQVRVIPRSPTSAEVLLAAYDLFGEFSIITGLMAVYGLSIVEGQVFSYQRGPGRVTPAGAHRRGHDRGYFYGGVRCRDAV